MKFAIRIEEIIGKTVIVEAENLEVAIKKVEEAADNGEFLLDDVEDLVSRRVFEAGIVGDFAGYPVSEALDQISEAEIAKYEYLK